jgi:hypothetical protein
MPLDFSPLDAPPLDVSPATSWVPTRIKYLLDGAKTGSIYAKHESFDKDPWIEIVKENDPPSDYFWPVVRSGDVLDHSQEAIVQAPRYGLFATWRMSDIEPAAAGSLLVVLNTSTGLPAGCKILAEPMRVESSVFVLTPKVTTQARWLRHVLMAMEPEIEIPGTGKGLERLLLRSIATPNFDDQCTISHQLDGLLPAMFHVEKALRHQADLVVERRKAMIRYKLLGELSENSVQPVEKTNDTEEHRNLATPRRLSSRIRQ